MCDNDIVGLWCKDAECTQSFDCYSISCVDGKCEDEIDLGGTGMATGLVILIVACLAIPACFIIGCLVCCIMGKTCGAKNLDGLPASGAADEEKGNA